MAGAFVYFSDKISRGEFDMATTSDQGLGLEYHVILSFYIAISPRRNRTIMGTNFHCQLSVLNLNNGTTIAIHPSILIAHHQSW